LTQKSLFGGDGDTEAPRPRASKPAIKANIDGGARGNPGPSAYGAVVRNAQGEIIAELSDYLGIQTNNFAEYSGLLAVLEFAVKENYSSLSVISDSELMVKQMKGQYKVKSPGLLELYTHAQSLVRKLEHFSIQHVLRAQNRDADHLVNEVLDSRARGGR
jgi:probable phosphoglycerate mutase